MKNRWTSIVTAAIILAHVLIVVIIMRPRLGSGDQNNNRPEENPAPQPPAISSPAAPVETAAPGGAGATSAPLTPSAPAAAAHSQSSNLPPPYSHNYYNVAAKAMDDKLKAVIKDCRSGLVIDLDRRTILWQKDAQKAYPIASLTKLLTAQMLLDRLSSDASLSLDGTTVKCTKEDFPKTKAMHGVYLGVNEALTLREYLKSMIISSANDCAYMVAKFLGNGDADNFIGQMNRRAFDLGLTNMKFLNANGLPVIKNGKRSENMGTALEVAYLAERATHYPEIMKWAGTTLDCIREDGKRFDLASTNKLLRAKVPGVTGLKTGYTDGAGQCIVITCTRENRNIMVVVMGVPANGDHGKRRDNIAKKLLEWAYTK